MSSRTPSTATPTFPSSAKAMAPVRRAYRRHPIDRGRALLEQANSTGADRCPGPSGDTQAQPTAMTVPRGKVISIGDPGARRGLCREAVPTLPTREAANSWVTAQPPLPRPARERLGVQTASGNVSNDVVTVRQSRIFPRWRGTILRTPSHRGGGPHAGGGGASGLIKKPSWQTGVPDTFPADGQRDVPDISLDASPDHDSSSLTARR